MASLTAGSRLFGGQPHSYVSCQPFSQNCAKEWDIKLAIEQ